jgi:hypothetical protein
MDFGIGFWILFFVIFFGCGKMCGWGARKYRERRRDLESAGQDEDRLSDLESRVKQLGDRDRARELPRPAMFRGGAGEKREHARVRQKRKSPVEELQQKFVDGRLTLAEYERELDRLERLE